MIQEIDRIAEAEGRAAQLEEQKIKVRNEILKESPLLLGKKRALFEQARKHDVYILEKGSIEDYYPDSVVGQDKLSKALSYCSIVKTPQQVRGLCELIEHDEEAKSIPELELICKGIFSNSA